MEGVVSRCLPGRGSVASCCHLAEFLTLFRSHLFPKSLQMADPEVVQKAGRYYRMVFDDYVLGSEKYGRPAVEGRNIKASLLMLGIEEDQIEKRFARFISQNGRDLASLDSVDFEEWMELASVDVVDAQQ